MMEIAHRKTLPPITDLQEAERETAWLPRSLLSPLKDQEERDAVQQMVIRLSAPCDPAWLMARVASLLLPYYNTDVPHSIRMMEAEDWADALGPYPQWAVQKAARWWKSNENPDRRKKPLDGDIVARARFEIGILKVSEMAIKRFDKGLGAPKLPPQDVGREKIDADAARARADEILAEVGFRPRRMEEE